MYTAKRSTFSLGYDIYCNGTYVGTVYDEFDSKIDDIAKDAMEKTHIQMAIMDCDNDECVNNTYSNYHNNYSNEPQSKIEVIIMCAFLAFFIISPIIILIFF